MKRKNKPVYQVVSFIIKMTLILIFIRLSNIIKLPHNILIFANMQGVYFYLLVKTRALFSHTLCISRKCCVVAQTGTPAEKWETVTAELKKRLNDAEFVNTICSATALRQKEAAKLASSVDVMIVIGGAASFNTKKLYELCQRKRYCLC